MAERQKLDKKDIPKKYQDKDRYSWSQVQQFKQCTWSFYMSRYLHGEDKDNFWNLMGGAVHDILDDYRNGKIKQEDMLPRYKKEYNRLIKEGWRLDFDDEKDKQMKDKYYGCVVHYFEHFYDEEDIEEEKLEYRFWTDIKGRPFSGFVDRGYKQKKIYNIEDYKTSSMYSKDKLEENKGQLFIYAKELVDNGVKPKDIEVFWDFIKYAKITYKLPKKYKITIQNDAMYDELIEYGFVKSKRSKSIDIEGWEYKDFIVERVGIGARISATLRKMLKAEMYNPDEIDKIVTNVINNNDLSYIPNHIMNKYEIKIEKAIVKADFTKDSLKEFEAEMLTELEKIEEYKKYADLLPSGKEHKAFERESIQESESFFCSKLCGLNHACKYFKQYMDEKEMFIMDEYQTDYDELRGQEEIIDLDDDVDFDEILADDDEIVLDEDVNEVDKEDEYDIIDDEVMSDDELDEIILDDEDDEFNFDDDDLDFDKLLEDD